MAKMKKLIIGNWKMNPATLSEAKLIFSGIKKSASSLSKIETIICTPSLYLTALVAASKGSKVTIGAQDAFYQSSGPFTGLLSPEMVRSAGADYVIIGHSERRAEGDTDEIINKKILAALHAGLTVIFCVGEKERSHDGHFLEFVKRQIYMGLQGVSKKLLARVFIAYEPVWAIGAEDAILPRDLHQMKIYIHKVIGEFFGPGLPLKVPVIYGGAVHPENAEVILKAGEVDGLLVGRESLDAKRFGMILSIANSLK